MRKLLVASAATLLVGFAANAYAGTIEFRVYDGAAVAADQIGSTQSSSSGVINGNVSNSTFNVSVSANGYPFLTAPAFGNNSNDAITASGITGPTTLIIEVTDTGLTSPVTPDMNTFGLNVLNGNDFVSASISNYFGPADNAFGMGQLLATATFSGGGTVYSDGPVQGAYNTPGSTYSETTIYTLNFNDISGDNSSIQTNAQIAAAVTPEPNSLVLLGTGLIGAAGLLFMRRRQAQGLL